VEWMIRLKEGLQSGRGWVGGIVLAGGRWDMLEGDGGGSLTWGIRPSSMRGRTRSDRRGGAHPRPPPRAWDDPLLCLDGRIRSWEGGVPAERTFQADEEIDTERVFSLKRWQIT
jgi:hypothetical protein